MKSSWTMKKKISFCEKKSFFVDVKDIRKIIVWCIVFVSVFSLRFVVERRKMDFSIAIAASNRTQVNPVADVVAQEDRIDLNTAGLNELQGLPGIGPKLAAAIIKSREVDGPFHEASDLLRVKGIGSKKLEKITPYLRFSLSESK